jgi:hypothetical protein
MAKPEVGHDYVIGCDWGRSNDYTVLIVLDATTRAVVAMDRSNRVDYAIQCDRLRALSDCWQPRQIIAEQNRIGQPVIEQLTRDGLRIQPFTTTNASKALVIEALALAFERGDIRILNDPVLVSELVAYQAERLPSGLTRYTAPGGGHDDTVMALAMAWSGVSGQHRLIYSIPDNDIVVEDHAIPDHWRRAYGLDIRWNTVAAIWGALDPGTDVLYLYGEHCGEADPAIHTAAIRARADWIPGVIDPSANGREQMDGERLIQIYRKHGLHLQGVDNRLESGILEVCQRMRSGRLKVFASLWRYREERRLYRRDEREQVVKEPDHLQDALGCLVAGICRMQTKKVKRDVDPASHYARHGDRSWMN